MERSVRIDWPAAVFYAEAEQEKFTELKIITLKSYYLSQVHERAIATLWSSEKHYPDDDTFAELIWKCSIDIIGSEKIHVRQFVEVDGESVILCLDVEEITDDTILPALDTLASVGVTHKGKIEFGPSKCFKTYELRAYG